MNFRQVHLDFHTSEKIDGIGSEFSKENFQAMLKLGHVNSITVFSKCHHGWTYHPTKASVQHPGLKFDLLKAQIEAAHEIGVKTPVYISAGLDEKYVLDHSDWLVRNQDQSTQWVNDFRTPGYHKCCFNSDYLDVLLAQIKEVVENYDADGIFLDIVGVSECYCCNCLKIMKKEGLDPENPADVRLLAERTYKKYTDAVEKTIHSIKPDMPIFHNGGHITRGRRDLAHVNTHLELESLPTGGWGYDHFPLSARYVQGLGMEFLGMTGKFHQSWGEFGGYKHPNALKYEVALAAANGAKCSIGDQLHPTGKMDEATYALIGEAYSYLEQIEDWCDNVKSVAEVGVLSVQSVNGIEKSGRECISDNGVARMLLEGKYTFDIIDLDTDSSKYNVIILPDSMVLDDKAKAFVDGFIKNGGKIIAAGSAPIMNDEFAFDLGAQFEGENEFKPTYIRPSFELKSLRNAAFVTYSGSYNVKADVVEGYIQNPYFNRTVEHFCSHRHTPCANKNSSPAITIGKDGAYLAWNIFEDYAEKGSLFLKEVFFHVLDNMLGERMIKTNLPAQGIMTVQEQQNRFVAHMLYAAPVTRGKDTQIIEDLVPIYDTELEITLPSAPKKVYLAPQMTEIPYELDGNTVKLKVDKFTGHQMIVFDK
ncbi:MAG: alpha-amylase family protein [Clostridia bacterium]|nr:alpha-amylase family protein [Clostridia bacterium]